MSQNHRTKGVSFGQHHQLLSRFGVLCVLLFLNGISAYCLLCSSSLGSRRSFHRDLKVLYESSRGKSNEGILTGGKGSTIVAITESDFPGAGEPRSELAPEDIPPLLMEALHLNDFPDIDSGLTSVWAFSGDTTRHIFQNNFTDFVVSAHGTARDFATSFYGVAMYGTSWEMETPINRVGGEDGWIATQIMKTISSDGRMRRWQWQLRKHRRPPNSGCWYVEDIGSSDRKGKFEPE